PPFHLLHQPGHHLPLLRHGQVDARQIRPPSGVHQVIDAEPSDVLLFDDAEDLTEIRKVFLSDRESDADANAGLTAIANAADGVPKGPFASAELIVPLLATVDADADVRHTD